MFYTTIIIIISTITTSFIATPSSFFFPAPPHSVLTPAQVTVGNRLGMQVGAVLSRMDSTIGQLVGNSLEVVESLETLKGRGPDDLMELVTTLGEEHHPTFI